jgi:hypothetical protein
MYTFLSQRPDSFQNFGLIARKINQWSCIFLSFSLFVYTVLRKYVINSISKGNSFISDCMKPLKEEKYSPFRGFFALIEIQFFLNLYDFLRRDTGMYIPETYRV